MTRRLCALALGTALAGCTVGPDYRKPPVLRGEVAAPTLIGSGEKPYDRTAPLPPRWWRLYDDPVLDGLIEKALINNTDLRRALANLEVAEAERRAVRAQRTPQTTFTGSGSYGSQHIDAPNLSTSSDPRFLYNLSEQVSYDTDLFGRLRRTAEAADATIEQNQAALDLARVNVAASTAQAYAEACSAGLQIKVTAGSIAVAQRTLDYAQRRHAAGLSPIDDVLRARAQLNQTRSSQPGNLARQRSALYMLATLTGEPPARFPATVAACAAPPTLRTPIPVGDGAALIARRPDIREAERRLAAAVADIGVSTAALYPSITIGGNAGYTKTRVTSVTAKIFSWNIGSLINWSFPNVSAARAQIAVAKASARGALAGFDGTMLTALRETETALTRLARDLDTQRDLQATRADNAAAYANTLRRYGAGVGQFIEVLDAERTLNQSDAAIAQAAAQVSQDQLSLFMALGGGWEGAPPVAPNPLESVTAPRR